LCRLKLNRCTMMGTSKAVSAHKTDG